MHSRLARRVSVVDLMVVVAAAAVGGAMVRATAPSAKWIVEPYLVVDTATKICDVVSYIVPLLVAWTPALLFMCMRHPRPRLARVTMQPGTVACISADRGDGDRSDLHSVGTRRWLAHFPYHRRG